jgi:hypothetical protein
VVNFRVLGNLSNEGTSQRRGNLSKTREQKREEIENGEDDEI